MKTVIKLAVGLLGVTRIAAGAQSIELSSAPIIISNSDQTATDALGRILPSYAETGPPKPNRTVGLFYWQLHGDDRWGKDYNVTEFLKTHPNFRDFQAHPAGGPDYPTWYWAQPLFGYYRSTDPWVIRKHLTMLSDSGVDFLFLDYTNGSVYDKELQTFLDIAEELKHNGVHIPKLVFFLNSEPEWKIESLYRHWYLPGKYGDMWFMWQGKPLMLSPEPTDSSKFRENTDLNTVQQYFTWRPTWAFHDNKTEPTKWRFMESFQPDGTMRDALGPDGKIEEAVVAKSMGGPLWGNMRNGGVSTKPGFVPKYDSEWTTKENPQGLFFQAQWDHAENVHPPVLLVTGWNEWTASVWETPGVVMLGRTTQKGQGHIVDEFNMDFNRDLEPMLGGYGDNYYWQFVANMRRYKGMAPPQKASSPKTIKLNGPVSQWNDVLPLYIDTKGDIGNRDWIGCIPGTHYVDTSARNDIVSAQVARDSKTVAFRVSTDRPISRPVGKTWMNLLINTDSSSHTGWNGYDLLVGRFRKGNSCSIESHVGSSYAWRRTGTAGFHVDGHNLVIRMPRTAFRRAKFALTFEFKWTDDLPEFPTVDDFWTKGDTAPNGRFNYVYRAQN